MFLLIWSGSEHHAVAGNSVSCLHVSRASFIEFKFCVFAWNKELVLAPLFCFDLAVTLLVICELPQCSYLPLELRVDQFYHRHKESTFHLKPAEVKT